MLTLIHCDHIDGNKISFRVIKCYVDTTPKWSHPKENIFKCEYFINKKARFVIVTFELQPKVSCAKETVHMVISIEAMNNKLYVLDEDS